MTGVFDVAAFVGDAFFAAYDRIGALDGRFLLPALVLQLGTLVLKSAAWRNVIAAAHPGSKVPLLRIGCAYVTGAAVNSFAPARGGELAKVVLARAQVQGASVASVAGTLVMLSSLDGLIGLVLVVTLWATGVVPSLPAPAIPVPIPVLAVGVATVAVALGLALRLRGPAVRSLLGRVARGFAVLRSPRRYALTVVPFQLGAWVCRIGVVWLVLCAFGVEAGLTTAALVVTLSGVSTAVPVPGGGGAQQVLATFALRGTATAGAAVSFSLGLQVGITAVNMTVGIVGAMLLFGTIRPLAAIQAARRSLRPAPEAG